MSKEKKIFFSVIVPIYNVEQYLDQTIESIINQKFREIEIILVNDGSTDNSLKICKKYQQIDERIKIITKKNEGLVSARQIGAEIAKGEYIVCIDGDDWVEKSYLQEFYDVIKEYRVDIVCCGNILSFPNKKIYNYLKEDKGYYDKKRIESKIYPLLIEDSRGKYFSPNICGKAIKSKIYKTQQKLVNRLIKIGEDHACIKPCIYHSNSLYIMDKCLYYYRQNPKSMTKEKKVFDWEGPKLIGQHFSKVLPLNEQDFKDQIYRNVVHNLFNVIASNFNRKLKYIEIKKEIEKKLLLDEYYQKCLKECCYRRFSKGYFALNTLRYEFYFLIYLYNKLKNK